MPISTVQIHLTMPCLSGFELYSRLVPLLTCHPHYLRSWNWLGP